MKQRKYLTRPEIKRLLEATCYSRYPERDRCLIQMGFIHGFRVSELCHLTLSDFDLEANTLFVRRLKNGFSTTHPLVEDELPLLRAWLACRKQWRFAEQQPWLFLSQKGGPLSRQQVYTLLRKLSQQACVSVQAHPHMLRHACGYALADQGADTRLIQDYLGHRNINHTVIYTASNPLRFSGIWQK